MKPSCTEVLDFLRARGAQGATEAEIQEATHIRSGGQRVHELRHEHGCRITKVMERSAIGAEYARWTLHEEPVRAGHPAGALRTCPSCHDQHHVGTTCAWPAHITQLATEGTDAAALPVPAARLAMARTDADPSLHEVLADRLT